MALVAFVLTHGNPVSRAAPVRDGPTNLVRDETAAPGTVLPFGDARFFGPEGKEIRAPIVAMAATPDGRRVLARRVRRRRAQLRRRSSLWFSRHTPHLPDRRHGTDARWPRLLAGRLGRKRAQLSATRISTAQPERTTPSTRWSAMAATPDGGGYWLVGPEGGVLGFGDAHYYGSTGSEPRHSPIVGIAPTPDGGGYWLVGSDGSVLSFGDAHYYGSAGGKPLHSPVVGMAPTVDGRGYWLVGSDGTVLSFGDAHFFGSSAGKSLAEPVVAVSANPEGGGYWLVEGERPPTAVGSLFTPALDAALDLRTGVVSAAVLDLRNGNLYTYRPDEEVITASIVKVQNPRSSTGEGPTDRSALERLRPGTRIGHDRAQRQR